MSNSIIGALRVDLSLASAQFVAGVSDAQRRLAGFEKATAAIGQKMQAVGTALTASVTAPLAGLAVAVQSSTRSLTTLANQAQMVGLDPTRFKVITMAAQQFGIEGDKVADILKDVGDKVGDFLQTGGGPLADFFENIAPKVGVTADQFRDLNSADALQLYISSLEEAGLSQSEMTFYLEAMANDLTLLAPLFAQNGAAIASMEAEATRLGLKLDGDVIGAAQRAQREFGIMREVLGVQLQQALVRLAPAFSELLTVAVPMIERLARGLASAGEWFSALSPEAQAFAAGMMGAAAALGPVLLALGPVVMALGGLVKILAAVGAGLVAVFGAPVLLVVSGLTALGAAVYVFWDEIKAAGIAVAEFAANAVSALAGFVVDAVSAFARFRQEAVMSLANFVLDAGTTLLTLRAKLVSAIADVAAQMFTAAQEIGAQLIAGIKAGIEARWNAVKDSVTSLGTQIKDRFTNLMGIRSPSRVFMGYGRHIGDGLAIGIRDSMPGIAGAMQSVGDVVVAQGDRLSEFGEIARGVFRAVALEGQSLGRTLRSAASNWFGNAAGKLFDSAFTSIGKAFGFANGGAFSAGRVIPFANGGVVTGPTLFPMPGATGLMGEAGPEAIMPLTRGPGGKLGVHAHGGGALQVTVTMDPSTGALGAFVRDQAGRIVAQSAPQIIDRAVGAVWTRAQEVPLP